MARILYVVSAVFFAVAVWRGLVSVDDHSKVLQVSNTQAIVSAIFSVGAFLGAVITSKFPVVITRICTNCGYNLTGNTSGICPECGCATKA